MDETSYKGGVAGAALHYLRKAACSRLDAFNVADAIRKTVFKSELD